MTFTIGAVGFARWREIGARRVLVAEAILGDERVALLQRVADGAPLPEGLVLIGYTWGHAGIPITAAEIRWDTSGIRPRTGAE